MNIPALRSGHNPGMHPGIFCML